MQCGVYPYSSDEVICSISGFSKEHLRSTCPHWTPPSTINRPPPVPAQQNYQQIYHWQTELRNLKNYQIKQGRAITEIMEKLDSFMTKRQRLEEAAKQNIPSIKHNETVGQTYQE